MTWKKRIKKDINLFLLWGRGLMELITLTVLSSCKTVPTFHPTSIRHLSGQIFGALTWPSDNVGSGFFVLGQCRVKFDFEQTLSRYQPNISIVLTVSGSCRDRLTGAHAKSPDWARVLKRITPKKSTKRGWFVYQTSCGLNGHKMGERLTCSSDNTQN